MIPADSSSNRTHAPTVLEYAKRPHLAWVSRHRKLLIVLAVCIAAGIPIYRNWQSLKHRALWIYWSQRAAAFKMPGPIQLNVNDPVEVKRLAATNPDYVILGGHATYSPLPFRELHQVDGRLNLLATQNLNPPLIFMGTLRRPDGVSRLVLISGSGVSSNLLENVEVLVLPFPGWFDPLPPIFATPFSKGGIGQPPRPVRFSAAVNDRNDPSRVTFDYIVGALTWGGVDAFAAYNIHGSGVIAARLENDDSLSFSFASTSHLRDPNLHLGPSNLIGDAGKLQIEALRGPFKPGTAEAKAFELQQRLNVPRPGGY